MIGVILTGAAMLLQAATDTVPSSPYPTVFGIQLMAPINIPECQISPTVLKHPDIYKRNSFFDRYSYSSTTICYERIGSRGGSNEPLSNEAVNVQFPFKQEPQWDTAVSVELINGRVEGVSFSTHGVATQQLVLSSLEQKFGKPTSLTTVSKQNGFGAKFDVISASWSLSSKITVTFEGAATRIDAGTVSVSSPAARAQEEQRTKQLLGTGTPM